MPGTKRPNDHLDPLTAPQERVDTLLRSLAAPPAGRDMTALAGQVGLAWLDVYENSGDEDAFSAGLGYLRTLVETSPDHADRPSWFLWIGIGHAERGRRLSELAAYDQAITWISRLYTDASASRALRTRAVTTLADVFYERMWLLRRLDDIDTGAALTEVDQVISRVSPLLTGVGDPDDLPWVRLVLGLAYLERHELTGGPGDLDRGVDLLATASLWEITAGTPLLGRVGSELANAWRRRGVSTGDLASIEQAIATGRRTIDSADPSDTPMWQMLHLYQAHAYEARWLGLRDTSDLEGAIGCWRVLVDADELARADETPSSAPPAPEPPAPPTRPRSPRRPRRPAP